MLRGMISLSLGHVLLDVKTTVIFVVFPVSLL